MTALIEAEEKIATEVFSTLTEVELAGSSESWRSETRLALLAWEIARYEPELADVLVEAGKLRLQAA